MCGCDQYLRVGDGLRAMVRLEGGKAAACPDPDAVGLGEKSVTVTGVPNQAVLAGIVSPSALLVDVDAAIAAVPEPSALVEPKKEYLVR